MGVIKRIEINPKIMMGKPIIRGTRVTVELILRKLAQGLTTAELVAEYPSVTISDVNAALSYAADTVAHEDNIEFEVAALSET